MGRPHRAARADKNQPEIVADLRKLGAYVWILSSLGGEILDILVWWRGLAIPVEIKVPGKLENLTEGEREGIRRLALVGVEAVVATCTEDIVAALYNRSVVRDITKPDHSGELASP